MGRGVGIEVDGVAESPIGGDEVEIVEEPQGSTNSVEGDGRQTAVDGVVDGFGIRMIGAGGNFPKDFEALLGEFEASFASPGFEGLEAAFDFVRVNFHGLLSEAICLAKHDRTG